MSEPNFEKIRGMSAGQLAMGLNLELHRRATEAQRRYDMARPGEAIQVDIDLLPFINRTEKSVVIYSDEVTDFPKRAE